MGPSRPLNFIARCDTRWYNGSPVESVCLIFPGVFGPMRDYLLIIPTYNKRKTSLRGGTSINTHWWYLRTSHILGWFSFIYGLGFGASIFVFCLCVQDFTSYRPQELDVVCSAQYLFVIESAGKSFGCKSFTITSINPILCKRKLISKLLNLG